jgi:carbamoyl-phosphate synthase small subunit
MQKMALPARLLLEDGTELSGFSFGYDKSCAGEVVFNTGMSGYPQMLSDPSYKGQIICMTYPLAGNFGVPGDELDEWGFHRHFESEKVQAAGLIVSELCESPSHFASERGLHEWLKRHKVPGIYGIDTRALTQRLREHGVMRGKIMVGDAVIPFSEIDMPVRLVSPTSRTVHGSGKTRILLVDCGAKSNILRCLLRRDTTVIRVPWDYDFLAEDYDGIFLSNGPGDPKRCGATIANVRRAIEGDKPIFGICLGNQLLALAAGADTYKLKFGHRGQNQPCIELGTSRCYITSQNHGYAVRDDSLPPGWEPWFRNANDGSNEGIKHVSKPFSSVQFHPEAAPGPRDTEYLFDRFLETVTSSKKGGSR